MTINVPELRKQLEFLSSNPEKHNQSVWVGRHHDKQLKVTDLQLTSCDDNSPYLPGRIIRVVKEEAIWSCGTVGCLAGWTAMSHGWRPINHWEAFMYRGGMVRNADAIAREILGLSGEEANYLFESDNTIQTMWRIANEITNGEIEIPEEYK